jgi:hypothetical protein
MNDKLVSGYYFLPSATPYPALAYVRPTIRDGGNLGMFKDSAVINIVISLARNMLQQVRRETGGVHAV